MSIFSAIKNAIFGHHQAQAAPQQPQQQQAQQAQASAAPQQPEPQPQPQAMQEVDVEKTLDSMPGSANLNWRTSIVDLMKLIDVDPSYEHREQLAHELGRADYSGSAEDNVWLHKATMAQLAANGAKVPASMTA
ncbi:MAG: DUF3597 domain-containing protein [Porphyrobacter sp.]|nr:DUF3597 domain-containing protein [Porphyrobacter sp.]